MINIIIDLTCIHDAILYEKTNNLNICNKAILNSRYLIWHKFNGAVFKQKEEIHAKPVYKKYILLNKC